MIQLPPAPKRYSQDDQNQLRRKLVAIVRDITNRLFKLENA